MNNETIDIIIYLVSDVLTFYCIYLMMRGFLGELKIPLYSGIAVYVGCYIIINVQYLILQLPWLNIVANICVMLGISMLYKAKMKTRILVTCLIYGVLVASEAMTLAVVNIWESSLLNKIESVTISDMFLLSIFCLLLCRVCINFWGKKEEKYSVSYWIMLIASSISCIFILIILESNIQQHRMARMIGVLVIIIVYLIIFNMYKIILNESREKMESRMLGQRMEFYREEMKVLMDSQERIRLMRHDLKNKYLFLLNVNEESDQIKMQEVLEKELNIVEHVKKYESDNPMFDAIINAKAQKMEDRDIQFTFQSDLPGKVPIDMDEITIILGNILDNAIEATSKVEFTEYKWINLKLSQNKGLLYITLRNSYIGELKLDKSGLFGTSKQDTFEHGLGLISVNQLVKKNGGSFKIELEENNHLKIFKITVRYFITE